MVHIAVNAEEKREFATAQFEELLAMGFSKRVAGAIMQAARPRLVIRAVEWVKLLRMHFTTELSLKSMREYPGWALTRNELNTYLKNLIRDFSKPINSKKKLDELIAYYSLADFTSHTYFTYNAFALPSSKPREIVKIAKAARIVLEHLKLEV